MHDIGNDGYTLLQGLALYLWSVAHGGDVTLTCVRRVWHITKITGCYGMPLRYARFACTGD